MRRSRRGAFGAGGGRSGSDLGLPREVDEIDDAIDPEDVSNHIVERVNSPRTSSAPATPAQRAQEVELAGSAAYAKEYRLTLLAKLLQRKLPLDQIAKHLGVSISTIEKDRALLRKRFRDNARNLNIDEMIGSEMEVYDEVTAQALVIASASTGERAVPVPMRLAALRTALAARGDKTRFLNASGVFDALRYRRGEDGDSISEVGALMENTERLVAELLAASSDKSFNPMTFADDEDDEVMEL